MTEPLQLVRAPLAEVDETLPSVVIHVDRVTLSKRLWRGVAADGTAFGFELSTPLRPGDTVHQSSSARYVLVQDGEPVVEISLALPPSAAAGIGWAIGNLHLELSAEPTRLVAPDEPAVRRLLERLDVPYRATTAVFRPGRFARGAQPSHELGRTHRH